MADFDSAFTAPPTPDAETLLTPITKIGTTPRTQMVRKLADVVVLPTGRISANERALVADILLQVIDKVDIELRREVAARIAKVSECPQALIRVLILDEPEAAKAILNDAESVNPSLLMEAARTKGEKHRLMIAKRKDLTTVVADAVIEHGEVAVLKAVLRREDCVLSPNAMNALVAHSAGLAELQPLLLRRRELEPAHGFVMFWWASSEHRRRILARFALDRRIIQDALADLYPKVFRGVGDPDPLVKDILILSERRHRPRGVDGEPVNMNVILRTLKAARRFPSQEIVEAVAMIGGVTRELASRILRDSGGEPFAVLCKSLGVARDDFFSLFEGLDEDDAETKQRQAEKAEYLLGVFDSMARDFSRAVLRYWDWESNPRIANITRLLALDENDGDSARALSLD